MRPDGRRMTRRDWDNGDARAIGVFLNGDELGARTTRGEEVRDDSFMILFNAHFEDVAFRLPARRFATRWEVEFATGRADAPRLTPGAAVTVESRSLVVLRRV
jgi:glycogen operon protein